MHTGHRHEIDPHIGFFLRVLELADFDLHYPVIVHAYGSIILSLAPHSAGVASHAVFEVNPERILFRAGFFEAGF
jgi:hypothetical protein